MSLSKSTELIQTPSEETTLSARGYKLLKKLGEGSYAKVYLSEYKSASNPASDVTLACKIIDTSKAPKDFVKKFLPRELAILVRLNHPHVIHVHSIFQRRSKYYIFMRNAENNDVLDFVLKNGVVAESQARVWFRQLILAIQYLHEMEVAHRDLKCENILITANFNIKVADFGFAREVVDERGKRVLSETYCGSLSYAAPEILKASPYNPKLADIWACGIVLYIMLNKAMPYDDSNVKRLLEQQLNRRWKFRSKVIDTLSTEVKTMETNILEPEVSKRWRLDQILSCDWILMDPRLAVMSPLESAAHRSAIEERRKRYERMEEKPAEKKRMSVSNKPKKSIVPQEKEVVKAASVINIVSTAAEAAAANAEGVNVIKEVRHPPHPDESEHFTNKLQPQSANVIEPLPTISETTPQNSSRRSTGDRT